MKKQLSTIFILLSMLLFYSNNVSSQVILQGPTDHRNASVQPLSVSSPSLALKTNLLYDLTTTINLGIEGRIGKRLTLDVSANYNPWKFSRERRIKQLLLQPELRLWTCEPFAGHFFGIHAIYAQYNISGVADLQRRYQGDAYGGGISYGYQWYLSPRWNLEATLGLGYLYTDYRSYECGNCGKELGRGSKHYFGPTKVGLTLLYIIK